MEMTYEEKFNKIKESFEAFKGEKLDLELAGIKELNTKILLLYNLNNDAQALLKDIKNKNNDDLVNDYVFGGKIGEFTKIINEELEKLKDAQRNREKLRNMIVDATDALILQKKSIDFIKNNVKDEIEKESAVLSNEDMVGVHREYHESLKNIKEKYMNDLDKEIEPLDLKIEEYDKEVHLLLNGGLLNYSIVDDKLVKKEKISIPVIEDEDVLTDNYENGDVTEEQTSEQEEAEVMPDISTFGEAAEEDQTEISSVEETESQDGLSIDEIRSEVAQELAEANEEPTEEPTEVVSEIPSMEETPVEETVEEMSEIPSVEETPVEETAEEKSAIPSMEETPVEETAEEVEKTPKEDEEDILPFNYSAFSSLIGDEEQLPSPVEDFKETSPEMTGEKIDEEPTKAMPIVSSVGETPVEEPTEEAPEMPSVEEAPAEESKLDELKKLRDSMKDFVANMDVNTKVTVKDADPVLLTKLNDSSLIDSANKFISSFKQEVPEEESSLGL